MRLILLFSFVQASMALLEAIPWEMMSWYNAYKIERMAYSSPGSWKIATGCSHRRLASSADFDATVKQIGLPVTLCTFDEFVKHIGTGNSFGQWTDKNPSVYEVDPNDGLEELRRMRANGVVAPRIRASDLLTHDEFPEDIQARQFDMARLQEIFGEIVEKARTTVSNDDKKSAHVEAWVKERVDNLRVVNMWRDSDQARWQANWIAQETKYGGSNSYKLLTDPMAVTYPDGSQPTPSDWPDDKHLETWQKPNWDRTYAQGGNSAVNLNSVRDTRKKVRTYGKWQNDPDPDKQRATMHIAIINKNIKVIETHEKPPAQLCTGKRRSVSVVSEMDMDMDMDTDTEMDMNPLHAHVHIQPLLQRWETF